MINKFKMYDTSSKVVIILSLIYLIAVVFRLSVGDISNFSHQHDFQVYYYAGVKFFNGENPYILNLQSGLQYIYPPVTLYPLSIYGLLSYPVAYYLYLALKLGSLFLFVKLIFEYLSTYYSTTSRDTIIKIVTIVLTLGFGLAIQKDLTVGNITIFEVVFVWFALDRLFKHKYLLFVSTILFISLVKLYLIMFIFLLVFIDNKKEASIYIVATFTLYILYIWLSLNAFDTQMVSQLLQNHQNLSHRTASSGINASVLALFMEIKNKTTLNINPHIWYIGVLFLVSSISIYKLFIDKKVSISFEDKIMYSIVTMYMIMPRLQDYSYVVLVPVVIVLALKLEPKERVYFLILALLPLKLLFGWIKDDTFKIVLWYQQYLDTAVLYIFYTIYLYRAKYINNKTK